jgi:RNA polymerase sigma-70 factor (ECF subfamily)
MGRKEDTQQDGFGQAERIRQGDRVAFQELFYAHYQPLCAYACSYVHSFEVAEDLIQEVFLDLWKRRSAWYPDHSLKAFLYGAVRNQALNYRRQLLTRRRAQASIERESISSADDPEKMLDDVELALDNDELALDDDELALAARRAIIELPEHRRHIFMLSREENLSYAEIASTLGISVKTVETQMARALRHLRSRLSSKSVFFRSRSAPRISN